MPKIVRFTKVRLSYGWMSNMSAYPVVWKGDRYRTTEALFQAMRFRSKSIRKLIRDKASPMRAKFTAKGYRTQMVVVPCSDNDVMNMWRCLCTKMEQHPKLARRLLATGKRRIIEDSTNHKSASATFWGAKRIDGKWVGENWMGFLWEQMREVQRLLKK